MKSAAREVLLSDTSRGTVGGGHINVLAVEPGDRPAGAFREVSGGAQTREHS
jgi:hypothetical protein